MATRPSVRTWGIPGTEEPGGPQGSESDTGERLSIATTPVHALLPAQ